MAEKEYIEREAVTNHIDFVVNNAPDTDYKKAAWGFGVFVSRLPAANVVPVRHGRWINENFYTHCSACGKMAIYDKYGQEFESDYCPHCGAKMDGGNLNAE